MIDAPRTEGDFVVQPAHIGAERIEQVLIGQSKPLMKPRGLVCRHDPIGLRAVDELLFFAVHARCRFNRKQRVAQFPERPDLLDAQPRRPIWKRSNTWARSRRPGPHDKWSGALCRARGGRGALLE